MRANVGSASDLLRLRVGDAMDIESGGANVTPAMARTFPVKTRNSNLVSPAMVHGELVSAVQRRI